jgi:hypothetical protein
MTVIKPSPSRHSTIPRKTSLSLALVLLSGLLLSGCWRQENRKELYFEAALPESWELEVERLDTDHDGDNEWVILYAFDDPGNKSFVPLRGAVYDISRRDPKLPIIYPYHLQAPGWTFLGEGLDRVKARMENVVTVAPEGIEGDTTELVVESTGPNGFVDRVSIFRWRDNVPDQLRKRTDPHEILFVPGKPLAQGEWYECVGMFAGTLKVELTTDRVTVMDRVNDRSQLARISKYSAKAALQGYMDDASYQLAAPDSVCIDFAHGMSSDVTESPYPEKIVLAYHKTFNQDPLLSASLLTENAQRKEGSDLWSVFVPNTRDVCITQISYGPPRETESEVLSFGEANEQITTDIQARENTGDSPDLTPEAKPIQALVKTTASYKLPGQNEKQTFQIEWNLVRDAASDGELEVWKIDSIQRPQ